MKTYNDLLKVICANDCTKPLYTIPKSMYEQVKKTTLGNMYCISITMVIDGKY